jgi:hypothetical protein
MQPGKRKQDRKTQEDPADLIHFGELMVSAAGFEPAI